MLDKFNLTTKLLRLDFSFCLIAPLVSPRYVDGRLSGKLVNEYFGKQQMANWRNRTKEVDTAQVGRKYRKARRKEKLPVSVTHPQVAAQWHPRKNKHISADEITYGSHMKVWWLCPVHKSHEWESTIHSRCAKDGQTRAGCPFCRGHRDCVTNSLASLFPNIASEWHVKKNRALTAKDVTAGSNREIWWQCNNDRSHIWKAQVQWRTDGESKCPFCMNKRVTKSNSLAGLHPKEASEWHRSKNGKLRASDVVPGSHKVVWWRCKSFRTHEWQCSVKSRITDQTGCPFCAGRQSTDNNNLAALYPEVAQEWCKSKNGKLSPESLVPGSHTKVWWRCTKNKKHVWIARVVSRTRSHSGCPFCAAMNKGQTRKSVSTTYNLAKLFPELAKEWHSKKNGLLRSNDVTPGSNKSVWWQCTRSKTHVWSAKVRWRTRAATGCPFCSNQKVCLTNSLLLQHPKIAAEWHPTRNGKLTPKDVVSGSHKKIWWQCPISKQHVWQATIQKRSGRGQSCPQCRVKR